MAYFKVGTKIEVRIISLAEGKHTWESAKISRQPRGGYPVAGYWAVDFAHGGGLAIHESGFRVAGTEGR